MGFVVYMGGVLAYIARGCLYGVSCLYDVSLFVCCVVVYGV